MDIWMNITPREIIEALQAATEEEKEELSLLIFSLPIIHTTPPTQPMKNINPMPELPTADRSAQKHQSS